MSFDKTGRVGLGDNAQPDPDPQDNGSSWEDEGGSPAPSDDD